MFWNKCNHSYKYFTTVREEGFFKSSLYIPAEYHFVCSSCGKVLKVLERKISDNIDYQSYVVSKNAALGNKGYNIASSELTLKPFRGIARLYIGKSVTNVIQCYKEKYGVDLSQIPGE